MTSPARHIGFSPWAAICLMVLVGLMSALATLAGLVWLFDSGSP